MGETAMSLGEMRSGTRAIVRGLAGGRSLVSRLAALGFTVGAEVEMLQNYGRGPIIVRVRDTRVALGRGESARVAVEAVAAEGRDG